jgi:hypothetical protein
MAEPALDLLGVAALLEEHGRAGVPERVEVDPRHAGLLCGRHEDAQTELWVTLALLLLPCDATAWDTAGALLDFGREAIAVR